MPLIICPPYYTALQQAIAAIFGFDPYFEYVTLLSHFDGSNGASTYQSTKGQLITGSTNATISTTDFKFGTASLKCTAPGAGATFGTNNAACNFGSNDFTVEAWVKSSAFDTGANQVIIAQYTPSNGNGPFSLSLTSAGIPQCHVRSGTNVQSLAASSAVTTNAWHHIAMVKSGTTLSIYVDGVLGGTRSVTSSIDAMGTVPLSVGANGNGNESFNGYLDEIRVTNGVARYSSDFSNALPTVAFPDTFGTFDIDPWYDSVTVMMHGDSMVESHGRTVTPTNAVVDSTIKPFGTASLKSTNGYMTVGYSDANDVSLGNQDFTVEAWIYMTAYQPINIVHASGGTLTGGNSTLTLYVNASGTLVSSTGGAQLINAGTPVPLNTWTHVVHCRNANTLYTYINGVLQGSNTGLTPSWNFTDAACYVGGSPTYTANISIKEFRLTKGVCRYTSNFVPRLVASSEQSLVAKAASYDPYQSSVVLQMRMDGADNGTTFADDTGKTVTAAGVKTVTSNLRSGTSGAVALIDPSVNTNGLSIPYSYDFAFGSNDFTIEAWIYPTSIAAMNGIVGNWHPNSSGACAWNLGTNSSGQLFFSYGMGGSNPTIASNTSAVVVNAWQHVAVVRHNASIVLFVNGVVVGNGQIGASAINNGDLPIMVGNLPNSGTPFSGYIDDVRVTANVARYTKKFTPPTSFFSVAYNEYAGNYPSDQYASQVVAYLSGDGAGVSEGTGKCKMKVWTPGVIKTLTSPAVKNSAINFTGTAGSYIELTDASNLTPNGDFTMEGWFRNTGTTSGVLFDMRPYNTDGNYLEVAYTAANGFIFYVNGAKVLNTNAFMKNNSWHHVAVCRVGSVVTIYLDGTNIGTANLPTLLGNRVVIGGNAFNNGAGDLWIGQMDEIRITNGTARYTANFDVNNI